MALSDDYTFGNIEPGTCVPFEPNMACSDDWDDYDDDVKLRAKSLAWSTIRVLTGGQVGSCPVDLRPCFDGSCDRCADAIIAISGPTHDDLARARMSGRCSCCTINEIVMPGTVAAITEVNVDGYRIDPQLFRVDNGNRLVRQDGRGFPSCQNMNAPYGHFGSFTVRYVPGQLPTAAGLWAVGLLADEFASACLGSKCRLPSRVRSIARQGVSMELAAGMFDTGTGVPEADAYIETVNPNDLRTAPTVYSPDLAKHRFTTLQQRQVPS